MFGSPGVERTIRTLLAIFMLATTSVGCAYRPAYHPESATLAPGHPAQTRSEHEAVIERVTIADASVLNAKDIEESLTINLAQLVSQTGYFKQVKVAPEKTTDGYRVRLSFDSYLVARLQHPALVPASFVTLTFYIWFGGPIFRDMVDLKATLRIQATDGQTLATVTDALESSESVGLYSPNFGSSDGSAQRRT